MRYAIMVLTSIIMALSVIGVKIVKKDQTEAVITIVGTLALIVHMLAWVWNV